jgi:hypothetical protein
MNDQVSSAPEQSDTAPQTMDAPVVGSTQEAPTSDWTAALDEDTRKTVDAKGWKSPVDAIKSYTELQRDYTAKTTNALTLPGENATPEDWNAFYAKVGRPEKAEGYEFKLPDGLPQDMPYDGKMAELSKVWAHEAGLTPKQAQAMHDGFARHMAETYAAANEASNKAVESAHAALTKAWGDPESPGYKRNVELANRAIRAQGGDALVAELKQIGALDAQGNVKSPTLAMTMAKFGEALFAEDAIHGGPNAMSNPFSPKSENLTEQGKIIRSDPQLAKALIRQAGHNPTEWGLR